MLTIQQIGNEIYSNKLRSLYFFTGPEYGVKLQYTKTIASYYENRIEIIPSFEHLISMFNHKSLIPKPDSLYIIRYDRDFINKLAISQHDLSTLKIPGTAIGIYELDSDESKLDKYFPENVVRINCLNENVAVKNLKKAYPDIPEMYLKEINRISSNYYQASLRCLGLSFLLNSVDSLSKQDIEFLFGYSRLSVAEDFKLAVVSRNYKNLMHEIESNEANYDNMLYDILAAMLDLFKVIEKPYTDSYAAKYVKLWNVSEIRSVFNETYEQINKLRSNSGYSAKISLMYLCGVMQFKLG